MMSFFNFFRKRRPNGCRSAYPNKTRECLLKLHPLFLAVGVWYAFTGELFLFLMSTLIALQHECAHAFAAAKLGYKLNKIVLMPFGAVIDGDLKNISFRDEIFVALCGPLCNLLTAVFFVALWWFQPTLYAFTDTAFYSSLSIALINLLPAYPLDGGRVLKCALTRVFFKKSHQEVNAEQKAERICRAITFAFGSLFLLLFLLFCLQKRFHFSMLAFGIFLFVGAFGNRDKQAIYQKMDFTSRHVLEKGTEIRHIAVLEDCTVKQALRFLTKDEYLVFEVYDKNERHLFDLPQNQFSALFIKNGSPYQKLGDLYQKSIQNPSFFELEQ